MREEILELAAQHGLYVEQAEYGDTFVSYRNCQIFFSWHVESEEWFFIVHQIDQDTLTGYPTLGGNWFDLWSDGIAWGKQVVDCRG